MKTQIFALDLSRNQATANPAHVGKGLRRSRHFPSFKKLLPGTPRPPNQYIQQPEDEEQQRKEERRERRKTKVKQAVSDTPGLCTPKMSPITSPLSSTRYLLSVEVTRKMGPLERAYTPARAPPFISETSLSHISVFVYRNIVNLILIFHNFSPPFQRRNPHSNPNPGSKWSGRDPQVLT